MIGVPSGMDRILFNACKVYGPLQLSHPFANWEQIHTEAVMYEKGPGTPEEEWFFKELYAYQPIFVLEKPREGAREEL